MAIHAEQNALLQCHDVTKINALYVTISPCFQCLKLMLNTPCKRIVFLNTYPNPEAEIIWRETGRVWDQIKFPSRARGILEMLPRMSEYIA
jgi:dCMP deaminase